MNKNKRGLLVASVLCGMLCLGVRTMFAPDISPITKMSSTEGQDPLEAARGDLVGRRTRAMRRSLIAVLSTDADAKHPAADFTQSNKRIFLVWQDRTGSKGDQIHVRWVAEAVDGLSKNRLLSEEAETLPGTGPFRSSFFLSPAKAPLPQGTYRAELYKNTTLVRALRFTVKP